MDTVSATVAQSDTAEFHRLSSLYRLLKRAAAAKSEREILRAFVDALAIWQDADALAYVGDVTGRFVLDVSLPGTDRQSAPAVIEGDLVPDGLTNGRLSLADREALGFRGTTDVILSRVRGRATSDWLIATRAPADSLAEARLAVYVEAVGQALAEMTAVESSRLTWAMLQHLLPSADALAGAAQGAVDALAAVVDGEVCFAVSRDGARVMTIAAPRNCVLMTAPVRSPEALTLALDASTPVTATIGLRRNGILLTGRDEHLLHLAASTLGAWLKMVAPRLPDQAERRSGPRSFNHLVEQKSKDALVQEKALSVMLVFLGPEPVEQRVAHAYITQIRGLLRPEDMAGRLASGHIGVVLPDTPLDGAGVVAERLRQLVRFDLGFGTFPQASVVYGGPSADLAAAESQLRDAYARVLGDAETIRGAN